MTKESGAQLSKVVAAQERADRIRAGIRVWQELKKDIIAAYQARDWETLGHPSWAAYLTGEFGELLPQFASGTERREIVLDMSEAGLSTRAIASATGESQSTVAREVRTPAGESNDSPAPARRASTGTDGKTYSRPAPPSALLKETVLNLLKKGEQLSAKDVQALLGKGVKIAEAKTVLATLSGTRLSGGRVTTKAGTRPPVYVWVADEPVVSPAPSSAPEQPQAAAEGRGQAPGDQAPESTDECGPIGPDVVDSWIGTGAHYISSAVESSLLTAEQCARLLQQVDAWHMRLMEKEKAEKFNLVQMERDGEQITETPRSSQHGSATVAAESAPEPDSASGADHEPTPEHLHYDHGYDPKVSTPQDVIVGYHNAAHADEPGHPEKPRSKRRSRSRTAAS